MNIIDLVLKNANWIKRAFELNEEQKQIMNNAQKVFNEEADKLKQKVKAEIQKDKQKIKEVEDIYKKHNVEINYSFDITKTSLFSANEDIFRVLLTDPGRIDKIKNEDENDYKKIIETEQTINKKNEELEKEDEEVLKKFIDDFDQIGISFNIHTLNAKKRQLDFAYNNKKRNFVFIDKPIVEQIQKIIDIAYKKIKVENYNIYSDPKFLDLVEKYNLKDISSSTQKTRGAFTLIAQSEDKYFLSASGYLRFQGFENPQANVIYLKKRSETDNFTKEEYYHYLDKLDQYLYKKWQKHPHLF
jgi:hypothetical protein